MMTISTLIFAATLLAQAEVKPKIKPGTQVTVGLKLSNKECVSEVDGNKVYGALDFNNGETPSCTPERMGVKAWWRDYHSRSCSLHFKQKSSPTEVSPQSTPAIKCITQEIRLGQTEIIPFEVSDLCPFRLIECHPQSMTSANISKSSVEYNFGKYLKFSAPK